MEILSDMVEQAFIFMPMLVIFAKIVPKEIEASCFAMITGTNNLFSDLAQIIGANINDNFVGVTKEDQSKYWILLVIMTACGVIPLAFLGLIPSN